MDVNLNVQQSEKSSNNNNTTCTPFPGNTLKRLIDNN